MLKSSKGIWLLNNAIMVIPQLEYASDVSVGPSPYWRYHGTRKSTTKSSLLGVEWLWQISLVQLLCLIGYYGQPFKLVARYLDYIATLHKVFYHQLIITYSPSILVYLPATRSMRQYHPLLYILPYSSTTAHQNS